MKHDVVVRDVLVALTMIAAEPTVFFLEDMKRAGHAEMHDQHIARRQIGEQVFGAPADAGDGLARKPARKILRQRPAQIAAPDLDLDEALAFHGRLEASAHGLDFGKFRHDIPASARQCG